MLDDDPVLRMLRRVVFGFAAAVGLVAVGALLLQLSTAAVVEAETEADLTVAGMGLVLGWTGLATAPVVGLRIGGLAWRRALWALPVLPLGVLLVDLLG